MKINHQAAVQEYEKRITELEEEVLNEQNGLPKHKDHECPKCKHRQRLCLHADTSLCSNSIQKSPKVSLSRHTSMIASNNNKNSPK